MRAARRLGVVTIALLLSCDGAELHAGRQPSASPDRHVVEVDGHGLTVWGRAPDAPRAVVLLVHGRTWSSLPDFDLQVAGLDRSVMQSLAARGLAAYAVDLRGYGATPRDATGWLTPNRSAADVQGVLAWIRARHPSLPPPALIGWSRGAAVAMLTAQRSPAMLSSLVLFGFAFDPASRFTEPARPAEPPRASNTADAARRDFISPAVTAPAVIRAFVAAALRADPVMVDLRRDDHFNDLDPTRVTVPVLVIYGDRDPSLTDALVDRMAAAFPSRPTVVVLPGADHAAHLERSHGEWVAAVDTFITRH